MPADILGTNVLLEAPARRPRVPVPARPDLRQPGPRRRDQPRHAQDPVRPARSDAGAGRHASARSATRCRSRSSCWRPRTRSSWKAPIRCPRPSSTASSSSCNVGFPSRAELRPDRRPHHGPARRAADGRGRRRQRPGAAGARARDPGRLATWPTTPCGWCWPATPSCPKPPRRPSATCASAPARARRRRSSWPAKIHAVLAGRFNVAFDDVRRVALPALRHRLILNYEAEAKGVTADRVVAELLSAVPEEAAEKSRGVARRQAIPHDVFRRFDRLSFVGRRPARAGTRRRASQPPPRALDRLRRLSAVPARRRLPTRRLERLRPTRHAPGQGDRGPRAARRGAGARLLQLDGVRAAGQARRSRRRSSWRRWRYVGAWRARTRCASPASRQAQSPAAGARAHSAAARAARARAAARRRSQPAGRWSTSTPAWPRASRRGTPANSLVVVVSDLLDTGRHGRGPGVRCARAAPTSSSSTWSPRGAGSAAGRRGRAGRRRDRRRRSSSGVSLDTLAAYRARFADWLDAREADCRRARHALRRVSHRSAGQRGRPRRPRERRSLR